MTQLFFHSFLIIVFSAIATLEAQTAGHYFLSADSLAKYKKIWLGYNSKYHPGDDSTWANPAYDDHEWESATSWLPPQNFPQSGWPGCGWFRLHLTLDSVLVNKPLAFMLDQRGAAEIYLDGKLWRRFGKVGASQNAEQVYWERNPQALVFAQNYICLAVRYSNFSMRHFSEQGTWMGFGMSLGTLDDAIAARTSEVRQATVQQILVASVPLTFALLHLALFLFYPRLHANAYFALFACGFALLYFCGAQNVFTNDPHFVLLANRWQDVFGLLTITAGVRFAYALFYGATACRKCLTAKVRSSIIPPPKTYLPKWPNARRQKSLRISTGPESSGPTAIRRKMT